MGPVETSPPRVAQVLRYRRIRSALFGDGEYIPVHATGSHAERVVAFARRLGDSWCLIAAPRITAPLAPLESLPVGNVWEDTALDLPEGFPIAWRNVLTGEEPVSLDLADIFRTIPLAVLEPV